MIKHPAFRVRSITHVSADFLDLLEDGLDRICDSSPLAGILTDYEITGSYARGCAELHSDLDINLATPSVEIWQAARQGLRQDKDDTAKALGDIATLSEQFGVRFDVSLQHRSAGDTPKMYYSLRARQLFGTETRRIDILEDGTVQVRQINRVREPKLSALVWNEELGDYEPFDPETNDPYLNELETWRALYGDRLLRYGQTAETFHMSE